MNVLVMNLEKLLELLFVLSAYWAHLCATMEKPLTLNMALE